jgi:hypothetical protein
MSNEKIIRAEAKEFFERKMNDSRANPIDDFHKLKMRLEDFYTPETKAIFLDEIQLNIVTDLQEHRIQHHRGVPKPDCRFETHAEKVLFYIAQEISTFPQIARQKFSSNPLHERNKVFISYSHVDKAYLSDIQRHFKPFLNQIDFWDDTKIQPGQKWKEEIKKAISETKIAILLVSTDFLGSDFIANDELPPLLEAAEKDGAVILTVILKPCLFEEFPLLNQYQAMNAPSKTVYSMDELEREELYVNLVRQTKRILNEQKIVELTE